MKGIDFAELLVEAGAHIHAFPCYARSWDTAILVCLTDGVHLSQRRVYSRVRLTLDARLVLGGHPEIFSTTTMDVSGGGAQIRRPTALPLRPSYGLALTGPLLPGQIFAEAVPARAGEDTLGLRFTAIEPQARQALIALVLHALTGDLGASVGPAGGSAPSSRSGSIVELTSAGSAIE